VIRAPSKIAHPVPSAWRRVLADEPGAVRAVAVGLARGPAAAAQRSQRPHGHWPAVRVLQSSRSPPCRAELREHDQRLAIRSAAHSILYPGSERSVNRSFPPRRSSSWLPQCSCGPPMLPGTSDRRLNAAASAISRSQPRESIRLESSSFLGFRSLGGIPPEAAAIPDDFADQGSQFRMLSSAAADIDETEGSPQAFSAAASSAASARSSTCRTPAWRSRRPRFRLSPPGFWPRGISGSAPAARASWSSRNCHSAHRGCRASGRRSP